MKRCDSSSERSLNILAMHAALPYCSDMVCLALDVAANKIISFGARSRHFNLYSTAILTGEKKRYDASPRAQPHRPGGMAARGRGPGEGPILSRSGQQR